jgi:spore maturation protein CgeB
MGLAYREIDVTKEVRERIRGRGYSVKPREFGDIHTFAAIPIYYWHEHLMPDLRELGPVSHFDYIREGFSTSGLLSSGQDGAVNRRNLQERLLESLERAHRQRPVDWAIFYAGAPEVTPSLMEIIATRFGIPTVNMSLDDKQAFEGPKIGECRAAVVDITRCFDLFVTSARVTCEWHLVEGGRPLYLPEGFNHACYRPLPVKQDIDVSFIGVAYGFRVDVVRYLQKHGINIKPFGSGWGTKEVWGDDQVAVINRSRINLGMGGIGYSETLTNVKTRDFEIPGTGGGVYLTTFNPDLATHFEVGREILCYHSRDEMLELIRSCLAHPEDAREIARRGRDRCLREHRWLHRYKRLLDVLGVLARSSDD